MSIPVTLIPGDGIGPEVVNAAVEVIEAAGARLQWERAAAGAGAVPTHGTPIPAETLESVRRNKLALKGPRARSGRSDHPSHSRRLVIFDHQAQEGFHGVSERFTTAERSPVVQRSRIETIPGHLAESALHDPILDQDRDPV